MSFLFYVKEAGLVVPDPPTITNPTGDCTEEWNAFSTGYTTDGDQTTRVFNNGVLISNDNLFTLWSENDQLYCNRWDGCTDLQNTVKITADGTYTNYGTGSAWICGTDTSANGDYIYVVDGAVDDGSPFNQYVVAYVLNYDDLTVAAGPTVVKGPVFGLSEGAKVKGVSGAGNEFLVAWQDNTGVGLQRLYQATPTISSVGPERQFTSATPARMQMVQTDDSRDGNIGIFFHVTSGQTVRMHTCSYTGLSVNAETYVSDGPGNANFGGACEYYEPSSDWWGFLATYLEDDSGDNAHHLYMKKFNRGGLQDGSRVKLADKSGHDWKQTAVCRMYDDYHYLVTAIDENDGSNQQKIIGWIVNKDLEIETGPWTIWDSGSSDDVYDMEVHRSGSAASPQYTVLTHKPAGLDRVRMIVLTEL